MTRPYVDALRVQNLYRLTVPHAWDPGGPLWISRASGQRAALWPEREAEYLLRTGRLSLSDLWPVVRIDQGRRFCLPQDIRPHIGARVGGLVFGVNRGTALVIATSTAQLELPLDWRGR